MGSDEITAIRMSYELNSGYWKVADRCFFNKLDCLLFATKIKNDRVTYHFFDEIYTNINWKEDPVQSLSSMYADRARKIREKYKYVSILFSGGADSTNVLKSFIDNNIHIDEIISFSPIQASNKLLGTFDRTNRSANNQVFEYYETVVPMFEFLKKYHPNIKLTVIDYTNEIISLIDTSNIHKLFLSGCTLHTNITGFYLAYRHVAKHDSSCVVLGIDKPRVLYDKTQGIFKSYFYDYNTMHGHFPKETFNGDQPGTEYFYYDHETPYIPVKQCKQILEYLTPILNPTHPLHSRVLLDRSHSFIVNMHDDYVKKLIYPTWNTSLFQADKNYSHFYHEIGAWMNDTTLTSSKMKDFYDGQLRELVSGVDPKFMQVDQNNKPHKFVEIYTKKIPLQ